MKNTQGFTLLELMVVVVIIAILAAIAYPSYARYAFRARRAEAQNLLMHIATAQERFYSTFNRYTDTPSELGYDGTPTSENGYYTVAIQTADTGQQFTATATPQGVQASDACGNLSIDNTGDKQPDINDTSANSNGTCW